MIVPGAAIYCEFREMTAGHRVAVLKNPSGTVILMPADDRVLGHAYFVVTWYNKRRADGILVGTIARTPRPFAEQ